MNVLAKTSTSEEALDLSRLTDQELSEGYLNGLDLAVAGLIKAAAHLAELHRRGADITKFPHGNFVIRIARGTLAPEAMSKFLGNLSLLRRIWSLPLVDQRKLASGDPVPLALGAAEEKLIDPLLLRRTELTQVFADDHIRSAAEQVIWIGRNQLRLRPSPRVACASIDRKRRVIVISEPVEISFRQLQQLALDIFK